MQYFSDILREKIASRGNAIIPSPMADIKAVELSLGKTFPLAYVEFLSIYGGGCDFIFNDSDSRLKDLVDINKWGAEVFRRNGHLTGPDQVFITHWQGYSFHYFEDVHLSDDPPVYLAVEGDDGFNITKQADSFSSFVEKQTDMRLDFIRKYLSD